MNVEERKYRFSEIMTAVSLLPDITMEDDMSEEEGVMAKEWILPDLTKGFEDMKVRNAILCQAMREDEQFKFKLTALISNSALQGITDAKIADEKPSKADLEALAVCANILWASGEAKGLFQMLGILGSVSSMFDMELPRLSVAFLRPQNGIDKFGKIDPFIILEDKLTPVELAKAIVEDDEEVEGEGEEYESR